MGKHYSQKDNLISIMTEISKKTPRGIMNGDVQVGHITWQMYLMRDYLKLDGTPLANASNDYSDLLSFAQDNNLITADTTDNSLFKYDSTTDVLTLPNYIDLVLQGGNTVEEKEAGLPNIKGNVSLPLIDKKAQTSTTDASEANVSGGFSVDGINNNRVMPNVANPSWDFGGVLHFEASKSNSIYSDSVNTVQPPAITLIPQIKYRKATTMYEQIDAVVNYSTTEKVIGTWIDGKPLYQITIQDTTPTTVNNEEELVDVSSLNISECINISAMIYHSTFNTYLPYTGSIASGDYIFYNATMKTVRGKLVTANYMNKACYITLKYTKTTD